MSSTENPGKCFLCRKRINETSNSQKASSKISSIYSRWSNSCAKSLCQLFNLDVNLFQNIFVEAAYCSPCHQVIRDIDYTLKSLNRLQKRLTRSRNTVESFLRETYEKIQAIENGIKQEVLDPLDDLDVNSSYSIMIKLLFDSTFTATSARNFKGVRKSTPPVILKVSSVQRKKSMKHKLPLKDDGDLGDYEKLTRNSRLKRSTATEPTYQFGDESDSELPEPVEAYDSDFIPKVETILGGVDNDAAVKNVKEERDSSSTDSESGSDWEEINARKPTKKNSSSRGKPTFRVISRAETKSKSSGEAKREIANNGLPEISKGFACTFDSNCRFTTASNVKLKAHINGKHHGDPKPFHCEECKCSGAGLNYKYGSATSYNYHRKTVHRKSEPEPIVTCDICKKSFEGKRKFRRVNILVIQTQNFFNTYLFGESL